MDDSKRCTLFTVFKDEGDVEKQIISLIFYG